MGAAHDPRASARVVFASALIVAGYLVRRKVVATVAWPQLLWLASFFVLALPAMRGVVWWGLAFPVVVAGLVARKADADEQPGSPFMNMLLVTAIVADRDHRDAGLARLPPPTPAPACSSPRRRVVSGVDAPRPLCRPVYALFVSQTYASWFEFALPSMPVFVDSRIVLPFDDLERKYLLISERAEGQGMTRVKVLDD